MMIAQSSEGSAIDAATKRNSTLFTAYIAVLLFTALVVAVFTWLTWDSGNKVQEAIRKDADARIQEAKQGVEQLKKDNLTLSSKLANLQDEAAKQQERAAIAERALLELQEHNKPRLLTSDQRRQMTDHLKQFFGQRVSLFVYAGDSEITGIAEQLHDVLNTPISKGGAGWLVSQSSGQETERAVAGILVELKPNADDRSRAAAAALVSSLVAEHLSATGPQPYDARGFFTGSGNVDLRASIIITIGKKF
jgi:cell division protein FtsB